VKLLGTELNEIEIEIVEIIKSRVGPMKYFTQLLNQIGAIIQMKWKS